MSDWVKPVFSDSHYASERGASLQRGCLGFHDAIAHVLIERMRGKTGHHVVELRTSRGEVAGRNRRVALIVKRLGTLECGQDRILVISHDVPRNLAKTPGMKATINGVHHDGRVAHRHVVGRRRDLLCALSSSSGGGRNPRGRMNRMVGEGGRLVSEERALNGRMRRTLGKARHALWRPACFSVSVARIVGGARGLKCNGAALRAKQVH